MYICKRVCVIVCVFVYSLTKVKYGIQLCMEFHNITIIFCYKQAMTFNTSYSNMDVMNILEENGLNILFILKKNPRIKWIEKSNKAILSLL